MKLTSAEIEAGRSAKGGFTKSQLAHDDLKPDPMHKNWRKGRATVWMSELARQALQEAYPGRQTKHVIEHGGRRLKDCREGFASAVKRAGLIGEGFAFEVDNKKVVMRQRYGNGLFTEVEVMADDLKAVINVVRHDGLLHWNVEETSPGLFIFAMISAAVTVTTSSVTAQTSSVSNTVDAGSASRISSQLPSISSSFMP